MEQVAIRELERGWRSPNSQSARFRHGRRASRRSPSSTTRCSSSSQRAPQVAGIPSAKLPRSDRVADGNRIDEALTAEDARGGAGTGYEVSAVSVATAATAQTGAEPCRLRLGHAEERELRRRLGRWSRRFLGLPEAEFDDAYQGAWRKLLEAERRGRRTRNL